MKKTTVLSVILAGLLTQTAAIAKPRYEIEVDPSTFALDGYSLHVRMFPDSTSKWRLGVGVYSLEFPDAFVDINSENKNQGWNVDLDLGLGLFAEYYFSDNKHGLYAGAQLAYQKFNISNSQSGSEQQSFANALLMPYVGYRLPLSTHYYVQGWLGVGYSEKVSGETQLGTRHYDLDPLVGFGALHVGYSF
ncbi:MAG: hypothetical protein ACRBHB_04045 [Arenicella sp.]